MREIKLTQGKVALVDDEDYDSLMQWKWLAVKTGKMYYAARQPHGGHQGRKLVFMHRQILNTPPELEVDHVDFDGLNNQKYNIRNCTHRQNKKNNRGNSRNKSGYIGVIEAKDRKKRFRAGIGTEHGHVNLPYFYTPIEAAREYDRAAIKYHGEFACLNFPLEKNDRLRELDML